MCGCEDTVPDWGRHSRGLETGKEVPTKQKSPAAESGIPTPKLASSAPGGLFFYAVQARPGVKPGS
jgi:hypothetical protein